MALSPALRGSSVSLRLMHIDPFLFTDAAVSEETLAFNRGLQDLLVTLPQTHTMTPQEVRDARLEGGSPWGPIVYSDHARDITIDGPGGELVLRIIEAGESNGVYLHIHGGGWVLGAASLSDVGNEAMATEAGVTVVSVDYRLAPEHPYPAGIDDCVAAAHWLIENSQTEFGTDKLTIGGESAGANLAAATLLRVKDESGYTAWRGANLVSGVYMLPASPSVRHWSTEGLVLDPETMFWFGAHYASGDKPKVTDPGFSPIFGVLSDMPPALFTIGTWDPLVDDTLFMASRWAAAGNETELAIYPGGVHAFDAFPTTIAMEARNRIHTFIKNATR